MVTRKEFEEYRERIQSPEQMAYDKARAERLKEAVAERKKKMKEKIAKAKEYTSEKLKEVEEYGTKTLKKVGKRLSRIDLTKEPKGYKKLQRGLEKIFMSKSKKVSSSEIKKRRVFELKKMKLLHEQRLDYLRAQAESTAYAQDPRFQSNPAEDQFLAEAPQVAAQQEAPREEGYPQYSQSQSSNMKRRIINGLGNIGRSLSRVGQRRPVIGRDGRPIQNIQNFPKEVQRELNRQNTILNMPNAFNKPQGQVSKPRITLMQGSQKAARLNFWKA